MVWSERRRPQTAWAPWMVSQTSTSAPSSAGRQLGGELPPSPLARALRASTRPEALSPGLCLTGGGGGEGGGGGGGGEWCFARGGGSPRAARGFSPGVFLSEKKPRGEKPGGLAGSAERRYNPLILHNPLLRLY